MHVSEPLSGWCLPAEQLVHVGEPVDAEVPFVQSEHAVADVLPLVLLPAEHGKQKTDAAADW